MKEQVAIEHRSLAISSIKEMDVGGRVRVRRKRGRNGYVASNKPLIPTHYYVFGLVMFIAYAYYKVASSFFFLFFF
jgi:hypothetical protein